MCPPQPSPEEEIPLPDLILDDDTISDDDDEYMSHYGLQSIDDRNPDEIPLPDSDLDAEPLSDEENGSGDDESVDEGRTIAAEQLLRLRGAQIRDLREMVVLHQRYITRMCGVLKTFSQVVEKLYEKFEVLEAKVEGSGGERTEVRGKQKVEGEDGDGEDEDEEGDDDFRDGEDREDDAGELFPGAEAGLEDILGRVWLRTG